MVVGSETWQVRSYGLAFGEHFVTNAPTKNMQDLFIFSK